MEIGEMTKDVDLEIAQYKKKLLDLRKRREEIIKPNSLRDEGIDFSNRGYKASEWLRHHDPDLFVKKSKMVKWSWNGTMRLKIYGANICYHRAIWETRFSQRVCKKASNGRTRFASHLTTDEIKLAKHYAKETADKWEAFWLNKLTDEEETAFIFLNRRRRYD